MDTTTLLIFQNLHLPDRALKLTECAGSIMNRYSEVQSSIVYQNVGELADIILGNEMANTTRIINIDKYTTYSKNELDPYYMLTIIVNSVSKLEKYFNSVYRILGWNSRAKHFIIYIGDEDIHRILKLSWEKYIIRLLIMDKYQNLYTYFPLEDNKCGKNLRKHFLFNCTTIDFKVIDNIYNQYFKNFEGCNVRVSTFPIAPYVINYEDANKPGFEIQALRELSARLNFTVQYVPHNHSYWGVKTPTNTYTRMYDDFYRRQANIMLGMLMANGSFLYDFDSSIAHTKSDLAFFVPAARKAHPWENLVLVYTKPIWLIILITGVGISIIWSLIGNVKRNTEGYESYVKCSLQVLGMILGESMTQPRTPTFRYIFAVWTFYSLVLTSTFESSLTSFLTKPAFEKDIDTMEQLTASELKIGGVAYARGLFEDNKEVYKEWINCGLGAFCVNRTADERDFAAMNDVRQVNYLSKARYINADGESKLHQMPIASSSYMWILMLKGFPLKHSFDKFIQRFIENGLMEKWMKEVSYAVDPQNSAKHIALNFDHIALPFVILGAGLGFALLAFIAEIAHKKIVESRKE